jgi:Mg-chelatase subunit ChlD
MQIVLTPEVNAIEAGTTRRMFVNVNTTSLEAESIDTSGAVSKPAATPQRAGIDLVMILDKSGSMGGEKEALLRDAVKFVIDELSGVDRMSLVAFDSFAKYLQGLTIMNESGRTRSHGVAKSRGLDASGGTSILAGMQYGMRVLNERKTVNAITTVFLMTDGQDPSNLEEKLRLAREIRAKGWFLFVFAFGKDHDAGHLNTIAQAADSSYIFINDLATIREAFAGAIGSQQNVAAKLLTVTVCAEAPGVVIHRASGGQYQTIVAEDGRSVTVSYPNLLTGESRDCLLEITIPVASTAVASAGDGSASSPPATVPVMAVAVASDDTKAAALPVVHAVAVAADADESVARVSAAIESVHINSDASTTILSASLTYSPVVNDDLGARCTVHCEPCRVARPSTLSVAPVRNVLVDMQANRIMGTDAIDRATAMADSYRLEEARSLLTTTRETMQRSVSASEAMTLAMINELSECLGRLQSRAVWEAEGRAHTMESYNVYRAQRGVYSKRSPASAMSSSGGAAYESASVMFQTSSSRATQNKASNTKTGF